MNVTVRLAAALALIGNPTIPQSMLKYSPCCYDERVISPSPVVTSWIPSINRSK